MKGILMKKHVVAILSLAFSSAVVADDHGKLIFQDDFERTESQETTDEIGNGWGTNSKKRAGGNKQVDLKDGAMYITMHPTADHAVSVTHPAEFRNGSVETKFMLEGEKDTLGLNFADLKFKEVHAGHLFKVTVGTNHVLIEDMKTGGMNMAYHAAKKAKTLTPEQKKLINSKKKRFPVKLESGKWYTLLVNISGDTVTTSIDDKEVATFTSEGFAHPTKRMLRLSVPKSAVVDEVKIWAASPAE
ncbi:MAG: hypothetical protein P1U89_25945 [Verrucomicrobiales bacterium]|nr:hypothetical protein [Verrucomicrobiales bacterium]